MDDDTNRGSFAEQEEMLNIALGEVMNINVAMLGELRDRERRATKMAKRYALLSDQMEEIANMYATMAVTNATLLADQITLEYGFDEDLNVSHRLFEDDEDDLDEDEDTDGDA